MPEQKPGESEQVVRTPPVFLAACVKKWGRPFAHDLAANAKNTVAPTWFGPGSPIAEDALAPETDWKRDGLLWCNPPFALSDRFAARIRRESLRLGIEVLLLTPAAVCTEWFTESVYLRAAVYFVRPRVKFVGEAQGFPMGLIVSHFGPRVVPGFETWRWDR
jgi:hypothetical protein